MKGGRCAVREQERESMCRLRQLLDARTQTPPTFTPPSQRPPELGTLRGNEKKKTTKREKREPAAMCAHVSGRPSESVAIVIASRNIRFYFQWNTVSPIQWNSKTLSDELTKKTLEIVKNVRWRCVLCLRDVVIKLILVCFVISSIRLDACRLALAVDDSLKVKNTVLFKWIRKRWKIYVTRRLIGVNMRGSADDVGGH